MKGRENSMPEKERRKTRCTALRSTCEFVLVVAWAVASLFALSLSFATAAFFAGSVSGSATQRYTVSTTTSASDTAAAVANGLAARVGTEPRYAPRAGPNVKAMEKHAPMSAIVAPREDSSEM